MPNQTMIIRQPYPTFDERLYSSGWRGFFVDIIAVTTFEITAEIISLQKMTDPVTIEIISILDITSAVTFKMSFHNNLEVSLEIDGVNHLLEAIIKEIVSINILSKEYTVEIISRNDLLIYNNIYTSEVVGLNRIESINPTYPFTEYTYTIILLVDDVIISNHVTDWQITIDEDSYVNSVIINFADNYLFSLCNPTSKFGKERIKIIIDDIAYQFLLERRHFREEPGDYTFGIWGRSKIALLDAPYAQPINDKEVDYDSASFSWYSPDDDEYSPYIWQTADRTASKIIQAVAPGFNIQMDIDDFIVRRKSFNVSNETPIEIINRLAKVVGAIVRTNLNGDVIIRPKSFSTLGTEVSSYTDLDNVLSISESFSFPNGYNKVLVRGPRDSSEDLEGTSPFEKDGSLAIELDDDLNLKKTSFVFGEDVWFRVYRSPYTLSYSISSSLGTVFTVSLSVAETILGESASFNSYSLRTDKPISTIISIKQYNGTTASLSPYEFEESYKVISSVNGIESEPVLISYTSKYDLYKLKVEKPGIITAEEIIARISVEETV